MTEGCRSRFFGNALQPSPARPPSPNRISTSFLKKHDAKPLVQFGLSNPIGTAAQKITQMA